MFAFLKTIKTLVNTVYFVEKRKENGRLTKRSGGLSWYIKHSVLWFCSHYLIQGSVLAHSETIYFKESDLIYYHTFKRGDGCIYKIRKVLNLWVNIADWPYGIN